MQEQEMVEASRSAESPLSLAITAIDGALARFAHGHVLLGLASDQAAAPLADKYVELANGVVFDPVRIPLAAMYSGHEQIGSNEMLASEFTTELKRSLLINSYLAVRDLGEYVLLKEPSMQLLAIYAETMMAAYESPTLVWPEWLPIKITMGEIVITRDTPVEDLRVADGDAAAVCINVLAKLVDLNRERAGA